MRGAWFVKQGRKRKVASSRNTQHATRNTQHESTVLSLRPFAINQPPQQIVYEHHIVALQVMHRAVHAGETLAEAQVVRRIVLWRLALRPTPVPAVLEVNHVDIVAGDDLSSRLEPQVV